METSVGSMKRGTSTPQRRPPREGSETRNVTASQMREHVQLCSALSLKVAASCSAAETSDGSSSAGGHRPGGSAGGAAL